MKKLLYTLTIFSSFSLMGILREIDDTPAHLLTRTPVYSCQYPIDFFKRFIPQIEQNNNQNVLNLQGKSLPGVISEEDINNMSSFTVVYDTNKVFVSEVPDLVVNFSYNKLHNLPENLINLDNVKELKLAHNYIKKIAILPNAEKINLSYNKGVHLDSDAFSKTLDLTWLDLSNNLLTTIPSSVSSLSHLEVLYLQYNNLTTETLNALITPEHNFPSLIRLVLYGNRFTDLPVNLSLLSKLESLTIDGNQLTKQAIKDTLIQIPTLKSLNISLKKFNPSGKSTNTYRDERDILTNLVPEIGHLSKLQKLDLSYNDLKILPDTIGNLKDLTELDVSYNQNLKELPASIGNLTNLEKLNIKGCTTLIGLPNELFENLHELRSIIYDANAMKTHSATVQKIESLLKKNRQLKCLGSEEKK